MAIQNPNTLKGWFVTLAKPVQNQFWDWIDSFRHKNEKIIFDDLHPDLQALINAIPAGDVKQRVVTAVDTSFLMLAEHELVGLWFKNDSDTVMNLAINFPAFIDGGNWKEEVIQPGAWFDAKYFKTMPVNTVYNITGITGTTGTLTILIDRKK